MKIENAASLPEHYKVYRRIDLQKDRRLMVAVNLLAFLIMALMLVLGHLAVPVGVFFAMDDLVLYFLRFAVMLGGILLYMVLHEAVHGVFMRFYGKGVKPTFGLKGPYAFAASRAYFNRRSYLIIGLSPIVIWGIVLLVLNLTLPIEWFWPLYVIQATNVSGAAGDLYVSALICRMPSDFLVQDDGVSMTFYLPSSQA